MSSYVVPFILNYHCEVEYSVISWTKKFVGWDLTDYYNYMLVSYVAFKMTLHAFVNSIMISEKWKWTFL